MAEPRGPPCGFLGLSSSGASGNNGDGRDVDLVIQANVGRYEVVDAASDASMPATGGNPAVDDTKEGNSKRLCANHNKQTGRRGWSKETWAGVRLDVPPPEPFAWMVSKAMKTVNRKDSLPENLKPYTRSELLEIVGMFPEAPPSAYEIKSARESRMDIAEGRFKYEKDSARHTKGGTTIVIDENYLYSLVPQTKLGGPQRIDRTNTLNNLEMLLVRIADGNLGNAQPKFLNRKLSDDVAAKKLRYEQTIRSAEGFTELSYLIKGYYDKVYEKAVRTWKHREDELYYHPEDRLVSGLARGVNEESVHRQLSTFTEVNVNSWAETDSQNPIIVRSNKGVRILSNDDPGLAFDERKEIEFPGAEAQADQLVPDRVEEACQSMLIQDTSLKKSNEEWEIYIESLIAELGEEYLTGGEITISINDKVSKLLFKLKEDPNEATSAFFHANGVQDIKEKDFVSVLQIIEGHLEEERGTVRSPYWRMLQFQKELVLRKLRLEIINKISNHQWYFVLQKIPPLEIKICMTHCAYPNCDYHVFEFMPAEGYRMVFMNFGHCCEPEYKLDDVREGLGTPGRTKDGQMLFCVSCVENLFNGVGLIKTKPSALGARSACLNKAAPPDVPIIEPKVMAPGLSIFAATLHTFIKPEIRYSWHEFWSLNSYEYHALMKWKNMCIRKTMWEIPSNRAFNLQILGKAADYDFVNFFGDDVLDIGEPRPSIVLGIDLKLEQVSVDDISTLENQKPSRTDAVKNFHSIKRKHPLSNVMNADDIGTSKLGHSAGASIVDKLNVGRTRVVKPLSEIMKLIDYRIQKAWGAMKPPYVPRPQRGIVDVPYRKWPPTYLWRSDYSKEWEAEKIRKQQKTIDSNYETINRALEARGLGDLINYQPKNDEDMSEDPDAVSPHYTCVICGTTDSLEWRRGPKGPKTLCNACGIRFFRDRGRLMVPVPE